MTQSQSQSILKKLEIERAHEKHDVWLNEFHFIRLRLQQSLELK